MGDATHHDRRAFEEWRRAERVKARAARDLHSALAVCHANAAWVLREREADNRAPPGG